MHVIAKRALRDFWHRYPQAETPLREWWRSVASARWAGPADAVSAMPGVSVISGTTLVFKRLGGNKFRIVANVEWRSGTVFIKFVGTHAEYDNIDVLAVARAGYPSGGR